MKTKKEIFIIALLAMLVVVGFDFELKQLLYIEDQFSAWAQTMSSALILLIYIVPLAWFFKRLSQELQLSYCFMGVTFMVAVFVPGWICGLLNSWVESLWVTATPNSDWLVDWNDALAAPLIEELVKGACALSLLYIFKEARLKAALWVGMVVGFGFQVVEDLVYIAEVPDQAFVTATDRLLGALTSHWMLTGMMAVGLAGCWLKSKRSDSPAAEPSQRWVFIFYTVLPILMHFLWNSPLNGDTMGYFIGGVTLYAWVRLYRQLQAPALT